jgi:hypothetical protein
MSLQNITFQVKNNLYVEAQKVEAEIYCFWEKLMEFITSNASARHILLKNPCNHNGGTIKFVVLMS